MPSLLATSGTEAPAASSASAWRSLRTICSGVCLFFIESHPSTHLGRSDSHSNWIGFRGAGHDQCVLLNEYGRFDEDAEYFEHNEPAVIEAVKAATQTFGGFKRKRSSGSKPEALIDGVLFRGENHIIFGGAGQGKTMLACYIASELTKREESVVYLDHENGAGRIFERMHALGCTEGMLEEHFYYFEDPASTLEDAPDYREMLAQIRPSLVVFDSLFGFMVAANLDENYGPDVGK